MVLVELGVVVEPEGAVPGAEFGGGLQEDDNFAVVAGVGGEAVPRARVEFGGFGNDDGVDALSDDFVLPFELIDGVEERFLVPCAFLGAGDTAVGVGFELGCALFHCVDFGAAESCH